VRLSGGVAAHRDRGGWGFNAIVARAWREYPAQPWRSESCRFSTGPAVVAKVTDVVGLYLAPPEKAVVLCVTEKSQIEAETTPP
jgi:hypothetical protein